MASNETRRIFSKTLQLCKIRIIYRKVKFGVKLQFPFAWDDLDAQPDKGGSLC